MRYAVYGKFKGEYFITSFPFEQRKFAENYYESKVKISKNNGDFVIFVELNKDIILRKFERWLDLAKEFCYNSVTRRDEVMKEQIEQLKKIVEQLAKEIDKDYYIGVDDDGKLVLKKIERGYW